MEAPCERANGRALSDRRRSLISPRFPQARQAMKKGIHPNYHMLTVVLNDGTKYKTRSTWGEPGQTLTLDIDPGTHPAWTGGQHQLIDRGGRLSRFNKRFQDYVKT
jgi:large subunit ribosomal protein L31